MTVLRGDQLDQNAVTAEELYVGDCFGASPAFNERYRAPTIVVADRRGQQGWRTSIAVGGLRYDAQIARAQRDPADDGPRL